ncbi:MAG: hypothetical protein HUK02_00505 [Bacteroidaceae bacterium]|nr:hypothetical protein [Bacteroidaceae bacterium]
MKRFLVVVLGILVAGAMFAQTDMTSCIVNPSFENSFDGWEQEGLQRQGNDVFKLKDGATYVEKWTGRGGKVDNAHLVQKLTGMPAGTYTLRCVAQNIQEDTPEKVQTGVTLRANDQQTQVNVASEYTVQTTIVDGTLTISFVINSATGNYVCVDDFHLTHEAPTADTYEQMHLQMQQLVDEALAIDCQTGTKEQNELDAAREAVAQLILQPVQDGVTEAVTRLKQAIYDYRLSMASEDNPVDMTSLIANPSFEVKGTEGWTVDGMNVQSNDFFNIKSGTTYMEKWTGREYMVGDCTLSQQVSLPNGRYRITAAAQNIQENTPTKQQTGAFLFLDEQRTEVGVRGTYTLEAVVVENQATIGFCTRGATGNWVAVDNFTATYLGRSEEMLLTALAERIAQAQALSVDYQNAAVKQTLVEAIEAAQGVTQSETMVPVAIALRDAMEASRASISAYAALAEAIALSEIYYGEGVGNDADTYRASIDAAQRAYDDLSQTPASLNEAVQALQRADFYYRLQNATGAVPVVTTSTYIARGATGALGRSTVSGKGVIEQGFCWATHPNPTVLDSRTTLNYYIHGPMYCMEPLEPATIYYVRAYALTEGYAVGYGEVRKVITLPMGQCSWSYDYGADPEANERIAFAVNDAINYYNNWSSVKGFHPSVHYGSGTPTADCSYGGWMRVGPNSAYQRTGTILHELNHGVGVGQHERWWDGNLHDGNWKGYRANSLLQFIENDPNATVAGDATHMWPYGINGAHEDTGWRMDYIANVMITQALHEDGLVPTGGGCTPCYTFESEDTCVYYITSESAKCGLGKGYLYETSTATLKWQQPEGELTDDDSFGWRVLFQPQTGYYRIQNVKTGHYFSYASGSVKLAKTTSPGQTENMQLMNARNAVAVGGDPKGATVRGYWIMAGNNTLWPSVLAANTTGGTVAATFDLSDAADAQRWVMLTADGIEAVTKGAVMAAKNQLQRLLDGARQMAEVPHDDADNYTTATMDATLEATANSLPTLQTTEEVDAATANVWQAITDYMTGTQPTSTEQPYDLTFLLKNPNMEDATDWELTDCGAPTIRSGVAEYFNTKFNIHQTLEDMPCGTYDFCVQGFQRPGSYNSVYNLWTKNTLVTTSTLYYKSSYRQKLQSIMDGAQKQQVGGGVEQKVGQWYIPDNMEAVQQYFLQDLYNENKLIFEHKTQGKMLLGLKNTTVKDADWTIFNHFRLHYYGPNFTKDVLTDVESIETPVLDEQTSPCYDLQGRRIATPVRGVYIRNGRKYVK